LILCGSSAAATSKYKLVTIGGQWFDRNAVLGMAVTIIDNGGGQIKENGRSR